MIEVKAKPCRGNSFATGHGCGKLSKHRKHGLCLMECWPKFLTTTDQGKTILEKSIAHGRRKVTAERKESLKTQKTALKSNVTNWKNKLQTEVQKICRLIDNGLLCPVRPNQGQQIQGGHQFPKSTHPEMRFNLHGLHRQSAQSNCWQNDDGFFRDAIANEYGSDYGDFIKSLAKQPIVKLSNSEYQQIYYTARKISNRLTKEAKVYSLEERIELRNSCNVELGIYTTEQSIFKRL